MTVEAYDRHTGRYGPELSTAFARFAGVEPGTAASTPSSRSS
jgi:hypothetical protein